MVQIIYVYKLPFMSATLSLGLKAKIFGLGLHLEAQVLSLGFVPCGLVNMTD